MPTLNWIGKDKVVNHHMDVPFRVLEHKYGFSEKAEQAEPTNSGNKIIHGDNLEALKALLPEYQGKVKCIYIDPPYNTGNEGWVYNDNVNDPKIKKWLHEVVGKEAEDLTRHDKWLCMMYPRLKLLHKLLSNDGVIFISIDENEMTNLRFICSDIFGSSNYVTTITVIVKPEGRRYGFFAKTHEYIVVFSKNQSLLNLNDIEVEGTKYSYFDEKGGFNLKGLRNRNVKSFNSTNRPNLRYPFYVNINNPDKNGLFEVSVEPHENWQVVMASTIDGLESVWRWGKEKSLKQKEDLTAFVGSDENIRIFQKERKLTQTAKTMWNDKNFHSIKGTRELTELLGKSVFEFPKPEMLIRQILTIGTNEDDIILDSFAGSATTAHAVLNLNKNDDGNRKFILVEMEDYAETVTAERVKRVINGYSEIEGTGGSFDFYKLGEPLFNSDNELNEKIEVQKINEYVFYTETQQPLVKAKSTNKYFLNIFNSAAYYFFYEKDSITTLDYDFLATLDKNYKAEQYIIYADNCLLSKEVMRKYNIIFKKIPRDISRF
ncbi:MAG TPA: site-specific DNA-methyltransferase [Bacteroidales bacterium]|jgi:adenine-specific DNA-methyltransferase|nr:site-specific DNA-methyltransferase [Bacteroidales bacterium]HPB24316.1 site-specific DNA-methyltransferase [Bacteroidales bacterium]HPI28983.1 site-specific DNA-methyltransferase [Bacteroidales bacterium]HQP16059.1 site-specific DNA-methyltransferase [Bacteroidales bacterium]